MKENSIDNALTALNFTEKEKEAFIQILAYAKASMISSKDNLEQFINEKIDKVI